MRMASISGTNEPAPWRGEVEGAGLGSGVSIIFTRLDGMGEGPALHRHPYAETFILRAGRVAFTSSGATVEVAAGQVVVVPPGAPHRFVGLTAGVEMIDIHASDRFVTEWLTSP